MAVFDFFLIPFSDFPQDMFPNSFIIASHLPKCLLKTLKKQ